MNYLKNNLAGFLVLGSVLLLLAGDLAIVQIWGYDNSVSQFFGWLGQKFPIAIFFFGVVWGHLLWPRASDKSTPPE